MLVRWTFVLTFVAAIGSCLVAGVLFAFSSFVMAALGRLPPEQGVAAMQSINVTVINPGFMLAFMGTALVCLILALGSLVGWSQPGSGLTLLAALLYLVGCIGVTMAGNVPLNDALATVQPGTAEAAALWTHYLGSWTTWNHLRTLAALAAGVMLIAALLQRARL